MNTKITFIFTILFLSSSFFYGQVTIGSKEKPANGALLDLKQTGVTFKGLLLSRVKLSNKKPQSEQDFALSIGNTGEWNKEMHVGLIIYNSVSNVSYEAGTCERIYQGFYVWNGEEWQRIPGTITIEDESTSPSDWRNKVLRHAAKVGVYEEFYSASFGSAGRWMITNLAATAYDGVTHSAGRQLIGPNPNMGAVKNTAYWAYPSDKPKLPPNQTEMDATNPTSWKENPSVGYLYTWDAATAGKGGTDGLGNIDDSRPTSTVIEGGYLEWDGTGVKPNNKQARRQGICPLGWHLPSDAEWSILSTEFQMNSDKYSSLPNIGGAEHPPGTMNNTSIGLVMKDACELSLTDYYHGRSNFIAEGGFSAALSGKTDTYTGSASKFKEYGYYWTSSCSEQYNAWARKMVYDNDRCERYDQYGRGEMYAVRCKKD